MTRRLSLALTLVAALAMPSVGCFGAKAPVTANPAPTSVQATRTQAIRVADEIRRGLVVARVVRNVAQDNSGTGKPITAAQMTTINEAAITLGKTTDAFLTTLEAVSDNPSLDATKAAVVKAFSDFTSKLPNAPQLTILVQVLLDTFVVTKGGN